MVLIGFSNILFRDGGSQHDYRNMLQHWAFLNVSKHFMPVSLRKINIQQNQIRGFHIWKWPCFIQKLNSFLSISGNTKRIENFCVRSEERRVGREARSQGHVSESE